MHRSIPIIQHSIPIKYQIISIITLHIRYTHAVPIISHHTNNLHPPPPLFPLRNDAFVHIKHLLYTIPMIHHTIPIIHPTIPFKNPNISITDLFIPIIHLTISVPIAYLTYHRSIHTKYIYNHTHHTSNISIIYLTNQLPPFEENE